MDAPLCSLALSDAARGVERGWNGASAFIVVLFRLRAAPRIYR